MAIAELNTDPAATKDANAVVVFYTSWCGDCWLSLEYEKKLSKELKGKVNFYRMDAEKYESIADKCQVERYPTYVFFRKGTADKNILVEPVSEKEVRNWINKKIKM
jgi:thiol-disulfide isomerase/thioredoxin